MLVVPVVAITVTVLSIGAKPLSTCSGSQGLRSSNSPTHMVYAPGCLCVLLQTSPGILPARLIMHKLKARPMVALARNPGPRTP